MWLSPGAPVPIGEATHVLVDLRSAPAGPTLSAFLAELASAALGSRESTLHLRVRAFNGMRDEAHVPRLTGSENAYFSRLEERSLVYSGGRPEDLELGFVVGPRVALEAARMIIALRQDRRAAILGEPLRTAVAEARMHPAGAGGMTVRVFEVLEGRGLLVPDEVPPDVVAETQRDFEDGLAAMESFDTLPRLAGDPTRGQLEPLPAETFATHRDRGEAARQAALVIAHGAVVVFFPYWD